MTPASEEELAVDRLLELSELDQDYPGLVRQLAEAAIQEFAQRKRALSEALQTGAWETVRSEGHGLKGTAGHLGATRLYELAKAVELAAGVSGNGEVPTLLLRIGREMNRLEPMLLRWQAGGFDRGRAQSVVGA